MAQLREIGCTVRPRADGEVEPQPLSDSDVEKLAEIEDARWNLERFMDGWKLGPKKDVMKKTSPYLVGWSDLPEHVREWDRQAVRRIPELLAMEGLEIVAAEEEAAGGA